MPVIKMAEIKNFCGMTHWLLSYLFQRQDRGSEIKKLVLRDTQFMVSLGLFQA